MKKGKKPGEFLKQKRSHKQRQHNQDMIAQLRNGDIFQAEMFALGSNGMVKVLVEAPPLNIQELADPPSRTIVCLAGGKHKNLHLADMYTKDNGGRCRVNLHNGASAVLEWENVFGVVLSVEQLEENHGS
jgi:hypothetical protein